ncbi:acetyl-CoA carboxylase biotin carboxylase subunit [Nocardia africana]|uniref:biotin carboxylase n=1 Tax=Nocardia africana TaxID=134964 RepID=A0A378WUH7_9NOCA|nr:biotin carboxylase N-terminal domain-containing protein [Nocardia africana]MCC3313711.1 ATP-grasp domain-containing protein [Nocardia africana]SUA44906.1 Acetyl-/propionyl-coenzyme A carboxylase alpha chain [Nocardia africana]
MFDKLLIANRGEIAVRIARTARRLGIRSVAVFSDADADAIHPGVADDAVRIGPAPVNESYLRQDRIIEAALTTGAQAVHPGYGLLSENADFAQAVIDAGLIWVGPSPKVIEAMGDKIRARELMAQSGVPVARGSAEPPSDSMQALAQAEQIGFPLMLKAAAGGGGIGMSAVESADRLGAMFDAARSRAERIFGRGDILLEQLIEPARHIEVQIMGTGDGIFVFGERDCSVQRRFQKVAEESPAPRLSQAARDRLWQAARRAGEAVDYKGAGTVEFLVDPGSDEIAFLEMNTRLQVEHPVTELVTRTDLVELQLLVAAGERVDVRDQEPVGHAIEFRLYAEDPETFLPAPGFIHSWQLPIHDWLRVDAGFDAGREVTRYYDPLIAKLCVYGSDRDQAIERARQMLAEIEVAPVTTNLQFLRRLLDIPEFLTGTYDTGLVARSSTAHIRQRGMQRS